MNLEACTHYSWRYNVIITENGVELASSPWIHWRAPAHGLMICLWVAQYYKLWWMGWTSTRLTCWLPPYYHPHHPQKTQARRGRSGDTMCGIHLARNIDIPLRCNRGGIHPTSMSVDAKPLFSQGTSEADSKGKSSCWYGNPLSSFGTLTSVITANKELWRRTNHYTHAIGYIGTIVYDIACFDNSRCMFRILLRT